MLVTNQMPLVAIREWCGTVCHHHLPLMIAGILGVMLVAEDVNAQVCITQKCSTLFAGCEEPDRFSYDDSLTDEENTRLLNETNERIELGGGGRMNLVVEGLTEDAVEIGLDRGWIMNVVESRLRSAEIYDENEYRSFLYIQVIVAEQGFSVDVEFKRWFQNPALCAACGSDTLVTAWNSDSAGTHGGNPSYIVGWITRQVEEFVAEFLRVRDALC